MQHNNDDNDKYKNVIGIYEGGGGRIAAGGGLFAGGLFAAGLIAGGLFASGINAAPAPARPGPAAVVQTRPGPGLQIE